MDSNQNLNQLSQTKTLDLNNEDTSRNKQASLTGQQLREKLEGYLPVAKFERLAYNTHMRYFIKNPEGKWIFRTGGFLKRNDPDHVLMGSGPFQSKIWKVSKDRSKFYYKPMEGKPVKTTAPTDKSNHSGQSRLPNTNVSGSPGHTNVSEPPGQFPNTNVSGPPGQLSQTENFKIRLEKSPILAQQTEQLVQETKAVKEINRQYRLALEQQQQQIQELRKQLSQIR